MKNSHALFFIGLAIIVMFLTLDLTKRNEATKIVKTIQAASTAPKATQAAPAVAAAPAKPQIPFAEKFKKEAAYIAKLQTNSEEADARIKRLASEMRPQDVESMFEVISNDQLNADLRTLAVELLKTKNDTASLLALQNFVANNYNINGKKWDRKKELETVLRAQAVESIATYPQKEIALSTLNYLQHKVDNLFLAERIGRASAELTLQERNTKLQEEEALQKLVE
jgi:hypothetical protein